MQRKLSWSIGHHKEQGGPAVVHEPHAALSQEIVACGWLGVLVAALQLSCRATTKPAKRISSERAACDSRVIVWPPLALAQLVKSYISSSISEMYCTWLRGRANNFVHPSMKTSAPFFPPSLLGEGADQWRDCVKWTLELFQLEGAK